MNVRCKMRVVSKSDNAHWDATKTGKSASSVLLQAMTDPANKSWSEHTPCGSVNITITNQSAVDAFELGECYFVDFSKAPAKDVTQ